MPTGIEFTIESLKEKYSDLKQHVSQCRKKGTDGSIADLRLASVPAKIKMLEVTRDIRDVRKINELLNSAKAEIEELEQEVEMRQHKINLSGHPELVEIEEMLDKVEELAKSDKQEAKGLYLKCYSIFNSFTEEQKKIVFDRLNFLRTMLLS